MVILGIVDYGVCIWGLVLYWEGREFWLRFALDFREKRFINLVKDWFEFTVKVFGKKYGVRWVGDFRKCNLDEMNVNMKEMRNCV